MRKRLRADHEEWEQERKNSYALSGQLPPDSHSDEEAQDDLAPIIGAYLQHQHSLLCGVELEPLAESDQDQLESAATKAIEKEHSMMMANDDRANSYTNSLSAVMTASRGSITEWIIGHLHAVLGVS